MTWALERNSWQRASLGLRGARLERILRTRFTELELERCLGKVSWKDLGAHERIGYIEFLCSRSVGSVLYNIAWRQILSGPVQELFKAYL